MKVVKNYPIVVDDLRVGDVIHDYFFGRIAVATKIERIHKDLISIDWLTLDAGSSYYDVEENEHFVSGEELDCEILVSNL